MLIHDEPKAASKKTNDDVSVKGTVNLRWIISAGYTLKAISDFGNTV